MSSRNAVPILIEGLRRLKYRGSDTAGIAIVQSGRIEIANCKLRVRDFESIVSAGQKREARRAMNGSMAL